MYRLRLSAIALLLPISIQVAACPLESEAQSSTSPRSAAQKITFDLLDDSINTAERSLRYEFCIPAEETYRDQVEAIDPSVTFYRHSRGRIGCSADQYLCLGETQGEQWRAVLLALASLDFIDRIDPSYGE